MKNREQLGLSRRWVLKVGSALVTDEGRGLDRAAIDRWVDQVAQLRQQAVDVILVSSGSVAEGMKRLSWARRPRAIHELQAAAAVGQMGLVQAYESSFQRHGLQTAQVLLTHEDLADRQRYLNARTTLRTLLQLGVVPVINENDTVATEEIRFGDNDTLAALVANLVEADLLIILTDQEGLFDRDPRQHRNAKLIREGRAGDPAFDAMASGGAGSLGRGGMSTKVQAAARAARSGTSTVIASGRAENVLLEVAAGAAPGTLLRATSESLAARKQWLAGRLKIKGRLHLDAGAARSVCQSGRSLLAVGVTRVEGSFQRGDLVACVGADGRDVARGLVNYDSEEARKIMGQPSDRIEALLGYVDEPELIHRDDMVVL